jgi:carbon-monoxide dehydrogenase large subunit
LFEAMSHHACLDEITRMMDYEGLRSHQAMLRDRGVYRGIGIASMIEITNPSAMFYGVGGVRVSAQDGCTVKMEPVGASLCCTAAASRARVRRPSTRPVTSRTLSIGTPRASAAII